MRGAHDCLEFSRVLVRSVAGLGGLWAERVGVCNIGLGGMLILGTWFGAYGGVEYGPWWGVVFVVVGRALGGLVHAVATVGFGVDHIVSGVAINLLGPGVARYLNIVVFDDRTGATQSPRVSGDVGQLDLPFLAGGPILGWDTPDVRSEEHTSELQSLMRISYAVFCLK